jgi:aryl-alcohol dehydrogenase-like predicted oxidoreductase
VNYRELGRTGWRISSVGFGAWAIGSAWGAVDDTESMRTLHRAVDMGVNFFDTADVYGDGHSERLIARLRRERSEALIVATKAGRRLMPHTADGYNAANLTAFVERSLVNLETEAIDLLQLHCPPTAVYYMPDTFGALDDLVRQGKVRFYGVSVERVEEALKAIEYPGVQSVQIIYNLFRQRPAELFFPEAERRRVGILARLPLSSGLLSGRMTRATTFPPDDHRQFNRDGASFDRGETFSGVDFEVALSVVDELRPLVPEGWTLAEFALRWILMSGAVTSAIPGGRRPVQIEENCRAAGLPAIPEPTLARVRKLYEGRVRPLVHHYW